MTNTQGKDTNKYIIDIESPTETARLMNQDRILTAAMEGIFPEHLDLSRTHHILDIACGPGGWALDVAHTYPDISVIGVDLSKTMVNYASAQAQVQKLTNVRFKVMDVLQPLAFPNSSFDMVNARFLFAFMSQTTWPQLLQECRRILRPGGIIRLTEPELPICNGTAGARVCQLFIQAFQASKRSYSPDGLNLGLINMLGYLLHNAGYTHIGRMAHAIDCSSWTPIHDSYSQNDLVTMQLIEPFLVNSGMLTQEEFNQLYLQLQIESLADDNCSMWLYLTTWGQKPLRTLP